jgi:hypothetical protein
MLFVVTYFALFLCVLELPTYTLYPRFDLTTLTTTAVDNAARAFLKQFLKRRIKRQKIQNSDISDTTT